MGIKSQTTIIDEVNEFNNEKPSLLKFMINPVAEIRLINKNPLIIKPLLTILFVQVLLISIVSYVLTDNSQVNAIVNDLQTTPQRLKVVISFLSGLISVFNSLFIIILIAIFFKICSIFFQKDVLFKKIFSLIVFTQVSSIVGICLNFLIAIMLDTDFKLYTNLAFLFEEDTVIYNVFASIDLFYILNFVFIGLGMCIIVELTKKQTILLMLILFALNIGASIFFQNLL